MNDKVLYKGSRQETWHQSQCPCRLRSGRQGPALESVKHGDRIVHIWTEAEIEHVRQLLPKIANGRKTRYKKKQSASAKTKATGKIAGATQTS